MFKFNEEFIKGKNDKCEDMIYKGDRYIAVIDGCTSKNNIKYENMSGGMMAAKLIYNTFMENKDIDFSKMMTKISENFILKYKEYNIDSNNHKNRMSAVMIVFDRCKRVLYSIGDCQCLIVDQGFETIISNEKKVDEIMANSRSLINQYLINSKQETLQSLMKEDKGRDFINPLLLSQSSFENKITEFGYGTINGFEIPSKYIKSYEISPTVSKIVLASDGYPKVFNNLKESEKYLKYILENDPLMISLFKSTKGLKEGYYSFDDRAFISFSISYN
jgi:hypothetical protein